MIGICIGIIISIFLGDLVIKNTVEKKVVNGERRPYLGGLILIQKHHNQGMALNLLEKKRRLVVVISVVFSIVMLVILILSFGQRGNHWLRIGLSLFLGGGFSNTYDRLRRKYVVDYISFGVKWKRFRRIVFNCSDFCIIIGALLITIGVLQ
ncbi:MAG: signal peptidase II [Lachnospiraceae bacterium]|nr:signal peptidase II [Lachnospiraceae bacterium]